MNAVKILSDFFNKKIWTISEFFTLSFFFVLNPLVIVVIDYVFGIQFLTGIVVGWITLFAVKTQWRKK